MKTQISRDSTRPEKRYSGVYQQQGRMITDADWNELTELAKRRLDDVLRDVVASGVPRGRGLVIDQTPSGPLQITAGHLYADGVTARVVAAPSNASPPETSPPGTFHLDGQADFPLAEDVALPTGDYQVYADVWERTVVSLEDDELRDAALHGADTCTRTQTMAQLKWCDADLDPENPAINPQIGDAKLTLELRAKSEASDPCDPCADLVAADARTGNYLFRVEVHDFVQDVNASPATTRLTLKWSRENGAEQHRLVPEPPADFKSGDWVYEFYKDSTEKHLGVHLAGGITAERGVLVSGGYPTTPPSGVDRVRRWDGSCDLVNNGSAWTLAEGGIDRGTGLVDSAGSPSVHGEVELGATVQIQLENLALTLTLSTNDSPVDDHTFVAGDYWLAPIREAIHAVGYKVLTDAAPAGVCHHYLRLAKVDGGTLVENLTDQPQRPGFPPLTELQASDVDYKPGACDDLNEAQTVQQALDVLCLRPSGGGGCRVTVGPGGELKKLEEGAIQELSEKRGGNLCLCLLPGEHKLLEELTITGSERSHLDISGCGKATRLVLNDHSLIFKDLASIGLRDLHLVAGQGNQVRFGNCEEVRLESFFAEGLAGELGGLVEIHGAQRVWLSRCRIQATDLSRFADVASIFSGFPPEDLFKQKLDELAFEAAVDDVARTLAAKDLPWRTNFASAFGDRRESVELSEQQKATFQKLWSQMLGNTVDEVSVAARIKGILRATLRAAQGLALAVGKGASDVTVVDSTFFGAVSFYGTPPDKQLRPDDLRKLLDRLTEGQTRFRRTSGRLCLSRNFISWLLIGSDMWGQLSNPGTSIAGAYRTAFLTDNVFLSADVQLVARDIKLSSNSFQNVELEDVGYAVGETGIYIGNNKESDYAFLDVTVRSIREHDLMTIEQPPESPDPDGGGQPDPDGGSPDP